MLFTIKQSDLILFDAGLFIGALLTGDTRHAEARPLVEAARRSGKIISFSRPVTNNSPDQRKPTCA